MLWLWLWRWLWLWLWYNMRCLGPWALGLWPCSLTRCVSCLPWPALQTNKALFVRAGLLHPDIFTNGGDQNNDSIPEAKICKELGILLTDGLGGKVQSSSWLLARSRGDSVKLKADPNE